MHRIYCFDLDATLCTSQNGAYGNARPMPDRIAQVNVLADAGHTIVVSTARNGMWEEFTRRQLTEWGLTFHVLSVGAKPYADYYVDDKAVHANDFFGDRRNEQACPCCGAVVD